MRRSALTRIGTGRSPEGAVRGRLYGAECQEDAPVEHLWITIVKVA